MNLGKLLCVGTSFFGGGGVAAYRLNRRASLPKFNEGKNPFAPKASKTTEAAPVAAKEMAAARAAAPVQKAPPPYAFKPASTAQRLATLAPPVGPPASQPPAITAKPPKPGWTTRLNPFRAPDPEPAQPSAVQTELSLDSLKVVHNDLADADVEIVPVKAHAETAVEVPILPPARRAWEYMGENLLQS